MSVVWAPRFVNVSGLKALACVIHGISLKFEAFTRNGGQRKWQLPREIITAGPQLDFSVF